MLAIFIRVINPFNVVLFEGKFPYTRIFTRSLPKKIKDTFKVLKGGTELDLEPFDWQTPFGVADICSLGFFRFIHALFSPFAQIMRASIKLDENNQPRPLKEQAKIITVKILAALPFAILGLAHLVCNGALRYAFASLVTVISLPGIFLTHCLTEGVRHYKANEFADEIEVKSMGSTKKLTVAIEEYNQRNLKTGKVLKGSKEPQKTEKLHAYDLHVEMSKDKHTKKITVSFYKKTPNKIKDLIGTKEFNPGGINQKGDINDQNQLDNLVKFNLSARDARYGHHHRRKH